MKLFRFLASKTFWLNLFLAVLLAGGVLWAFSAFLDNFTRHGENIRVPDLQKLDVTEVEKELAERGLTFTIIDSAEFDPAFPRGSVIAQYPEAGSNVKLGRDLRLTINPITPRKIPVPDVVEKTKRRAIYDLESKGFKVGELEYVPYLGKDVVVDVKVGGRSLGSDEEFIKGTVIDLVLGEGLGDTRIRVPYLRWLSLSEAEDELKRRSLNLGSVLYDEELEDTAAALVYRQRPQPSHEPRIKLGQEVDVWLTDNYKKIPNDSLEFSRGALRDSLISDSLP